MAGEQEPGHFDEESEGGPVKSFLEHLEDFRWVLVKSIVALGLGMLISTRLAFQTTGWWSSRPGSQSDIEKI